MGRKVLIAEDEPNIVASLEFLLQQEACEVRVARDGEQALRLAESFVPDLVLLDVMMPLRNGFEVCRSIRENPALRGVKILMLSAQGREVDRLQGLGFGADGYVTKPFQVDAVMKALRTVLGPEQPAK